MQVLAAQEEAAGEAEITKLRTEVRKANGE
jgi:hypothetical protein